MGQTSEQRKRELLIALKHRSWLFGEIQERVALRGWKSHCMFSGEVGHCKVPESAHHCLAGIRRKYAAAVKRVKRARSAFPDCLSDPEAVRLEEAYQTARRKRQSVAQAS